MATCTGRAVITTESRHLSAQMLGKAAKPSELWKDPALYAAAREFGFNEIRGSKYDESHTVRKAWEECLQVAESMERAGKVFTVPDEPEKAKIEPAQAEVAQQCVTKAQAQVSETNRLELEKDPMFWAVRVLLGQYRQNLMGISMALDALSSNNRQDLISLIEAEGIVIEKTENGKLRIKT